MNDRSRWWHAALVLSGVGVLLGILTFYFHPDVFLAMTSLVWACF